MKHTAILPATKISPISNTVVKELNASVLTATFPGKGIFKADLYEDCHSSNKLVYHGSCSPVNGEFIKTVTIEL